MSMRIVLVEIHMDRSVIKENTARVVAARQNKVLLVWCAILNRTAYYGV